MGCKHRLDQRTPPMPRIAALPILSVLAPIVAVVLGVVAGVA